MEEIKKYLVEEKKMNMFFADEYIESLKKHEDIAREFLGFIESGKYENEATSGEWTAKTLSEKFPHLEPEVIFEFLVGLRNEPEKYNKYISDGAKYL